MARAATKTGADLFSQAAASRVAENAPLAARLRPRSLDDVVGQRHLLAPGRPLRALIDADRLRSIILWGPPGTGKTTLARLIADHTTKRFVALSAITAGVKDVREEIDTAKRSWGEEDRGTIVFLDEIHRFNRAQQDALLPAVEDGTITLIGATTENPAFEVNGPLLSRAKLFRLQPLSPEDLSALIIRAVEFEGSPGVDPAAADHLVRLADGDARSLLTTLEIAFGLAHRPAVDGGPTRVTLAEAEAAVDHRVVRYGDDAHYDIASALIKSIRGSDPDAGLYWLARMLEAGEDARFIARRLVILASEDVGLADPMSIVIADAAARAVEFVGLPEAQLSLAQAVIHLACAPKSNAVTAALAAARAAVRERSGGDVPPALRDAHYQSAARFGHGKGYSYPHDYAGNWVAQQYLPDDLVGTRFYEPTANGHEARLAERLAVMRNDRTATDSGSSASPSAGS